MALSYHGVVGHTSKTTLPSVETWGTNMNILRDPPKSIQTRKIDKVGETSEITQMIQESGDRSCEAIMQYARGVNPMVSVSYGNYGNNGGNRSKGLTSGQPGCNGSGNSGQQAYLPYRIMNGGAFRYPIYDQRSKLPLSRLPRTWTSSFTQPGFADFSKKTLCQGTDENTKGVKNQAQTLKACVRPRVVYQIQTPLVETYEVKNVIQNPIKVAKHSGTKTIGKITTQVQTPTKEVYEEVSYPEIHMNKNGNKKDIDLSHFDTQKYTQDPLHANVQSQVSRDIQITPINELYNIDTEGYTKNQFNIDYTANRTSTKQQEYIHDDIELSRVLPQHQAHSNIHMNIHKRVVEPVNERQYIQNRPTPNVNTSRFPVGHQAIDIITNRDYHLKPTINAGGFEMTTPSVPTIQREQQITEFDTEKTQMRQRVFELQQGRYEGNPQNPFGQLPVMVSSN